MAQTSKGDGRPVVSLRPLYLCLQCPVISTEAERDQHVEAKSHCFGGFESTTMRGKRLTQLQRRNLGMVTSTVDIARISYMILS